MPGRINLENLRKLYQIRKQYTLSQLYVKIREKWKAPYRDYSSNVSHYLPDQVELERQRREYEKQKADAPLVSIVVPLYQTPEEYLVPMVDSVIQQTYGSWELCLADGSEQDSIGRFLDKHYQGEPRIRYHHLSENSGISGNTNQAFAMARGEYIALLDHDDVLVPSALFEMIACAEGQEADLVYSDEDKMTADGTGFHSPHFKLDYNPELLLRNNYICHFLLFRTNLWEGTPELNPEYDGAQDYDFVLRVTERAKKICHVPKILYHWRIHEGSTAGDMSRKQYAYDAGKRAIEAALLRRGLSGTVTKTDEPGFYQVRYGLPKQVSVTVQPWGKPSRNWEKIRSQLQQELQQEQIEVRWEESPKSDAGDFVLKIHRGITRIKPQSVTILLGMCGQPDVLAVSARILKRGKVHNCGYKKEKDGMVYPRFQGLPREFRGYFLRAVLAADVEQIQDVLTVYRADCECGRLVVEPQAEAELPNVVDDGKI